MGRYCYHLAISAGMPEAGVAELLNAAPMHDIGKVGIPDSILLKPGKLNSSEWEVMKSHTTIGAEILAGGVSALTQLAGVVALTHHERWDGSGYPNGLAGEDIPLEGRIAAICDVFDALTSERPYKKPWLVSEALDSIEEMSGLHFDPSLVAAFLNIEKEILDIRESLLDENDAGNNF